MKGAAFFFAMLLCLLAFCGDAVRADTLRPGYLELTQQDDRLWRVTWKAPLLGGLASRARPAFPEGCRYSVASTRMQGFSVTSVGNLACKGGLIGKSVGLEGMEAGFNDALLRISPIDGPVQVERLTPDRGVATVAAVPGRWQVARTYLVLGVEHILAGYDHLLFVLALVLLLRRPGAVVMAVTAFTVAHSITLAGTTLGLIGLAQAPVEAVIALSIIFLAVEIVKQSPRAPRLAERAGWLVAFLFGLLHGFGFAGALREIGIPEGEAPIALLTFNLGVEAGQLVVVAAALAMIALVNRTKPALLRPAVITSAYLIGTAATFWFIERMVS